MKTIERVYIKTLLENTGKTLTALHSIKCDVAPLPNDFTQLVHEAIDKIYKLEDELNIYKNRKR